MAGSRQTIRRGKVHHVTPFVEPDGRKDPITANDETYRLGQTGRQPVLGVDVGVQDRTENFQRIFFERRGRR